MDNRLEQYDKDIFITEKDVDYYWNKYIQDDPPNVSFRSYIMLHYNANKINETYECENSL